MLFPSILPFSGWYLACSVCISNIIRLWKKFEHPCKLFNVIMHYIFRLTGAYYVIHSTSKLLFLGHSIVLFLVINITDEIFEWSFHYKMLLYLSVIICLIFVLQNLHLFWFYMLRCSDQIFTVSCRWFWDFATLTS